VLVSQFLSILRMHQGASSIAKEITNFQLFSVSK
jgi:hypothetical protein